MLENKELELEKIHTSENSPDMLTKCITSLKLEACCQKAGLGEGHAP